MKQEEKTIPERREIKEPSVLVVELEMEILFTAAEQTENISSKAHSHGH